MLLTIVNWIIWALTGAMDLFTRMFFSVFDLEPIQYLTYFPVLGTAYSVFRGLGYGLVFVLAAFSLLKFFQPGIFGGKERSDTPAGVLFKAMVATALVYGGNYILQYIMEIATVPYEAFRNLGIAQQTADTGYGNFWSQLAAGFMRDWTMPGVSEGTSLLVLVTLLLIGYNFFKLVIEIAERYVIVGVLLFTSPPFFALSASADTMQSFKSWIRMFISACIMMFVSVFSCKLVLSGLSAIAGEGTGLVGDTFIRLLLVLAMCKVSQHLDSYLKQIGLGTAETGGALLDDVLATGKAVNRMVGKDSSGKTGGSSKSSILGSAGVAFARYSPAGSFFGGMASEAKRAYAAGESPSWEKIKAAGERAQQDRSQPFVAKTVADVAAVVSGEAAAGDLSKKIQENAKQAAAETYGNVINPRAGAERRAGQEHQKEEVRIEAAKERAQAFEANQNAVRADARTFGPHINAEQPYTQKEMELMSRADGDRSRLNEHETGEFYRNHGILSGYTLGDDGELTIAPAAVAAGITYSPETGTIDSNNDSAKAEFLCETYGRGAADTFDDKATGYILYASQEGTVTAFDAKDGELEDASSIGAASISGGRKTVAEKMAFDPRYELRDDDEMGTAMLNKMNGTEYKYYDVRTENMPAYTDEDGREYSGGHTVSGKYADKNGNTIEFSAVNEAGYRQMQAEAPEKAKEYEKVESDTGMTYWVRSSKATADNRVAAETPAAPQYSEISGSGTASAEPTPDIPEPVSEVLPDPSTAGSDLPAAEIFSPESDTYGKSETSVTEEAAQSHSESPENAIYHARSQAQITSDDVQDTANSALHVLGDRELSPALTYSQPSSDTGNEGNTVQSTEHVSVSSSEAELGNTERRSFSAVEEFFSSVNAVSRNNLSDARRIDDLESLLSHTDIFAGQRLGNMVEYRAGSCTGWSVDAVNDSGAKVQYIGIDSAAWQAMSAELRGKFTAIPPVKGHSIEYVAVKDRTGVLSSPQVKAREKVSGLPRFAPPMRKSSNRAAQGTQPKPRK